MDFSWIVWGGVIMLLLAFGLVILIGAPYLPTTKQTREDALDLLALKRGQTLVDLGCGDGTMLIAAAKRGLKAVGYEINPILVAISWLRILRYRKKVKVKLRNFWKTDLSEADGVFVFLITHHMKHLDTFILCQKRRKSLKLASHAFKIPGKQPSNKRGAVFLYEYA